MSWSRGRKSSTICSRRSGRVFEARPTSAKIQQSVVMSLCNQLNCNSTRASLPMRKLLVIAVTAGFLGLCVYLQAEPSPREDEAVKIRVKLIEAETGKAIPGIVRAFRVG